MSITTNSTAQLMQSERICIVIPTYNNAPVLSAVIDSVLPYSPHILVVNDGSTDATSTILQTYQPRISVLNYTPNRGKSYALKMAFQWACQHHFSAVLTLDSDGQHRATDIPTLLNAYCSNPNALILGSRSLSAPNMPSKNTFANRFSNFWFTLQTGRQLSDTQTGFRIYPLHVLPHFSPLCHRYEGELEMLVRIAWRNLPIYEVPIQVYYPPREQRITHFRPTIDFLRISLLNTVLCLFAIVYGYPSILIRKLFTKRHSS